VTAVIPAGCDLLGWELREIGEPSYADEPGAVVAWPLDNGRWSVVVLGASANDRREYNVDGPTLMVSQTLAARAVPALEVGPCPECEGSKWDDGQDYAPPGPCRACTIDGKPTGVDKRPVFEAVLMGAPRECPECDGEGSIDPTPGMEHGSREPPESCDRCGTSGTIPGHEGARTALRQLAEGWREHLPVLADEWQARGGFTALCADVHRAWTVGTFGPAPKDKSIAAWLGTAPNGWADNDHADDMGADEMKACAAVPRPLAECPALPTIVLAWLAGACPGVCESGRIRLAYDPPPGIRCPRCAGSGLAIGPHLPALEAGLLDLWRRATVECERCEGKGHAVATWSEVRQGVGMPRTPGHLHPRCPGCAGLGRVKP
jgi:hypothetical protein